MSETAYELVTRVRAETVEECAREVARDACGPADEACSHQRCNTRRMLAARVRALATPSPETGTAAGTTRARCVRCFAAYAADGSCSRRQEGCQGGRGEWVAAAAEAATAIAAGPAPDPVKPPEACEKLCDKASCDDLCCLPADHDGYHTCTGRTPAAGTAPTPPTEQRHCIGCGRPTVTWTGKKGEHPSIDDMGKPDAECCEDRETGWYCCPKRGDLRGYDFNWRGTRP